MRQFWYTSARFSRILITVAPIYFAYFRIWARQKLLGETTPPEIWQHLHREKAREFYRLAVHMRGGLIKVGQIISTRVDIVPVEWTQELSALQDKVEPTPWPAIERHLREQLGAPPDAIFEWIEHEAVAAASFGQVHRARTHDGRDVALKVKYEDIDYQLACDLTCLRVASPFFNIFVPKLRLDIIHQEIGRALTTELDYRQEAEFTRTIGENLKALPNVVIPEVVDEYSTESVICTTYFDGFKATDVERLSAEGLDTHDVIRKLIEAYAHMFFVDGVFQSDPHPGNLMLRKRADGTAELCILDFGQVKILPTDFQRLLVDTSVSFMVRDVDGFSRNLARMGIASERDLAIARPLLHKFFTEMFELSPDQLKQLDAELLKRKIKELLSRIEGVHIPQDIVLYGRAFGLLAGVIAALDSRINGIVLAKPIIMSALMRPTELRETG